MAPNQIRINALKARIEHDLPGSTVKVDGPPVKPNGYWFLDIQHQTLPKGTVVEFRPVLGFGLSHKAENMLPFTGPDEVLQDEDALLKRLQELAQT